MSFAGDGTRLTSPIVLGAQVFVSGSSGNLYAAAASTGQEVWNIRLTAGLPSGARWGSGNPVLGWPSPMWGPTPLRFGRADVPGRDSQAQGAPREERRVGAAQESARRAMVAPEGRARSRPGARTRGQTPRLSAVPARRLT